MEIVAPATRFQPPSHLVDSLESMQGLVLNDLGGIDTTVVRGNTLEWRTMRDTLDYVNRMAMNDLVSILREARKLEGDVQREFLLESYRALVSTYGGVSADLTAEWFSEITGYTGAVPAEAPTWSQMTKEVSWGMAAEVSSAQDLTSRMALLMQKRVFGAHRDTVSLNALNNHLGFQRYARPDACAFCRVLASRGAVYGSKTRATLVGMAGTQAHYAGGRRRGTQFKPGRVRGKRKAGMKYHDHCRCILAPESSLDVDYPDGDVFEEQYLRAVELADELYPGKQKNMQLITKVMREYDMGA